MVPSLSECLVVGPVGKSFHGCQQGIVSAATLGNSHSNPVSDLTAKAYVTLIVCEKVKQDSQAVL